MANVYTDCIRLKNCDQGEVHRPFPQFVPNTHTLYFKTLH